MKKLLSSALVLLALTSLATTGCKKSTTDDDASTTTEDTNPTDGSQSKSQLAGSGTSCEILASAGSVLNGKAMTRALTLNADGTYSLVTDITAATACSNGHPSGGGSSTVYAQYNVAGAWAVGGTNTTPSISTKITFIPTTQVLTVYTPQTYSESLAIAQWANNCSSWGATLSTTGTDFSSSFQPTLCSAHGNVDLGTPPTTSQSQYNIGYNDGSTIQLGAYSDKFWSPGAGTFPTAYSVTLY